MFCGNQPAAQQECDDPESGTWFYRGNASVPRQQAPAVDYSTSCQRPSDVLAARQCKPRFVWAINALHDGTGLTLKRLQEDVSRLTKCESALKTEAGRVYDFTPVPVENQSIDEEPELAQQTV